MPSAAYYRAWRAAHPEYLERQRQLRRERRSRMTPEERRKDRGSRPPRLCGPVEIPPLHQGHPLFDEARRLARATNGFKYYQHPFYDDLLSEIVVGLLEGNPDTAQKSFLARERNWLYHTMSLRAWRDG